MTTLKSISFQQNATFLSNQQFAVFRGGKVSKGEGDYLASGQQGEIYSHVEDGRSDTKVVNEFHVRVVGTRADLLWTFESENSKQK